MVEVVRFRVEGPAIPQPRPRIGRDRWGLPRAYRDEAHAIHGWRELVAIRGRLAMGGHPPLEGPLLLAVLFLRPRPGRLLRRSAPPERVWCDVLPDLSNLEKGLEDALRGITYPDDGRIACKRTAKAYVAACEHPSTEVLVRRLRAGEVPDLEALA